MSVFYLQMNHTNYYGAPVRITFECEHADTESLATALNRGDVVAGSKLRTRERGDSFVEIAEREPIAVSRSVVAQIQPYRKTLVAVPQPS